MLQWFVDDRNIDRALKGYYHFKETEVEQVPENIPSAARDESINMAVIEEYFEDEAKIALHHACRALKDLPWFCGECQSDLQNETFSIGCDGCLNWFHGSWFCSTCTQVQIVPFCPLLVLCILYLYVSLNIEIIHDLLSLVLCMLHMYVLYVIIFVDWE